MKHNNHRLVRRRPFAWILLVLISLSCDNQEESVAPYLGATAMGKVIVQDSTLTPQVFWSGGYVSVFGVNLGLSAALDSTLVFFATTQGDNIHYPVTIGRIPPGAADMVATYGGRSVSRLLEDSVYTFWVMKADAWSQASGQRGRRIRVEDNSTTAVTIRGDTIHVGGMLGTTHTQRADAYVNIKNILPHGRLGNMWIQETDTSDGAILSFQINQAGVTDTLVAAMGLVINSGVYNVDDVVWEVLSVDSSGVKPVYRTKNVISSPVLLGQQLSRTAVFKSFSVHGLIRNKTYYAWIATKEWDGLSRDSRIVPYYAWVTFVTW
jgi:hypothetical protein